jgi:DNA-binding NarL/FixJ family response regulator
MELSVLIAEPSDILRIGLRTILAADERVTTLLEASSTEALQKHLRNSSIDLVIVNQIFVSDITTLPANRFVLLASEFNIATLLMAFKHGARGYLLETSQAELFRVILATPPGTFLIEPTLAVNVVGYLTNGTRLMVKEELLTPREKEVVGLLREGVDRSTIAKQLNISGATLKTHIKNIFRKRIMVSVKGSNI